MRRTVHDNFKKRFGDPPRIEIKFEAKKASFVEEADRSKKMAEAATGILRGVLGREPTQDEILGRVDIAKASPKRKARNNGA
ncbi:MAG: hypothetical protein HZB36_01860 [Candidatus Omnitrophica bacterium]|nr:hypothetical protein [Candidatus Omnitrophota bacterium]